MATDMNPLCPNRHNLINMCDLPIGSCLIIGVFGFLLNGSAEGSADDGGESGNCFSGGKVGGWCTSLSSSSSSSINDGSFFITTLLE